MGLAIALTHRMLATVGTGLFYLVMGLMDYLSFSTGGSRLLMTPASISPMDKVSLILAIAVGGRKSMGARHLLLSRTY